jgi:hypothetical protein
MMNYRDPRLADAVLLAIAGRRLLHRLSQPPLPDWQETEGLCAILDYARHLPPRNAEDLEVGTGPFATLLREARQWQQAQEDQA